MASVISVLTIKTTLLSELQKILPNQMFHSVDKENAGKYIFIYLLSRLTGIRHSFVTEAMTRYQQRNKKSIKNCCFC